MRDKHFFKLIEETHLLLNISPYLVEKDFYVTRAIEFASQAKHDLFELVFQGGTCLAKAHRVIERMSEDCDFRIVLRDPSIKMSKDRRRKSLRQFRHLVMDQLLSNGFTLVPQGLRVRNEGQFMSMRLEYPASFLPVKDIKPFLAMDYFLDDVLTPVESKPITSLIQQTLGNKLDHATPPIKVISVLETAREKWVALTRRIANLQRRPHYHNPNLVRHLYDLYCIHSRGLLTDEFGLLACHIINKDRLHYKRHNEAYYLNPVSEIRRAVDWLSRDKTWVEAWAYFLGSMVYGKTKPSFHAVLENLSVQTQAVFTSVKHVDFEFEMLR